MKKILFFLICFSLTISAISQLAIQSLKTPVAKAGSFDISWQKAETSNSKASVLEYDSLNMFWAGGWSLGQSFCIESSPTGDTIFIGSGAGVIIMDASDPYNPVLLSEVHARALVDGIYYNPVLGRLYLAAYFSGLEIWDVSDITQPSRISRIPVTGLPRSGIYEKKNGDDIYCILVTVADGIQMFDVTVAENPVFVGSFPISNLAWSSTFNGTHLFLGKSTSGTQIVEGFDDIPNLATFGTINSPTTDIAVDGDYAYILHSGSGLKIYEWQQQPAAMVGQLTINGYPNRIAKWNDMAYVANSTTNPGGGVNILDLTNPEEPAELGFYNSPNTYITGNGHLLATTGGQEGCLMLDVSDPENPEYASSYLLPVSENDIAVRNDYAYTGNNGFRVFDVSEKTHPVQVGYNDTPGALVKLHGDIAVFCPKSMGSGNRVNFMDISDPINPTKISYYNPPAMTYDLDLKGTFAYVACWWDGIRVVDFTNPQSLALSAHVMGWVNGAIPGEEWFYCQALDVEDDYLYAIDYGPFPDEDTRGVYVFDISDPGNPQLLKRLAEYQGTPYDIEVSNGYAYLADNAGGLSVVSVQDPLSPIQTSYLPLGDAAWAVDVFANYAFVANYINEGVQVIDISIPSMPTVAGYYKRTGCFALNVTYDAGHVYVADGPAGIQIYNFDLLSGRNEKSTNGLSLTTYPVPANDILHVNLPETVKENAIFEIFDLSGRKQFTQHVKLAPHQASCIVDVSHLPDGIYLLNIRTKEITCSSKIVIN
ncbi:MAG: T9SS type A sorting domain-containing protein [Bacteroidetes bacterium]|nr:T9SS type A sorting domain-containing protein [Bacteroidota bacterium]